MKAWVVIVLLSLLGSAAFMSHTKSELPIIFVDVEIEDKVSSHIRSSDQSIEVVLQLTSTNHDAVVKYHWIDFQRKVLTKKNILPINRVLNLKAPQSLPGYYGLVLTPESNIKIGDREPGEIMEYGFSIQTEGSNNRDQEQRFGTVHSDRDDSYLPAWIKTLTWNTTDPQGWAEAMIERRQSKQKELPIIVDEVWQNDDQQPVDQAHLKKLAKKVKQYFLADPTTIYWELGIEENLIDNYQQNYYWENLAQKVKLIKRIAAKSNPKIKLIYQIAGIEFAEVRAFLRNPAADYFDILSIHPYAWPDFPDPDIWLADYIKKTKSEMHDQGKVMPIWFTEVGAPHHGNHPSKFFGYPEDDKEVPGLSRARSVEYMIKLHVIAFNNGIEKVFWYNYRDQESEREYAENHFGMIDYWGFPKPVYSAYTSLYQRLSGKDQVRRCDIHPQITCYEFSDKQITTKVLWSTSEKNISVTVNKLETKLTNAVGTSIVNSDYKISVGKAPIFLSYKK